jgi:hypothetical protein
MGLCDPGGLGGVARAMEVSRPRRDPGTPAAFPAACSPPRIEMLEARAYLTNIPLAPALNVGGVTSPAGIAVSDFNVNGTADIAVVGIDPSTHQHAVAVYLDGSESPVFYDLPGDNGAQDIVTGDFNGDSNTDIAVSDPVDAAVTAYLATADFNGDGMADLAVTDPADHQIAILLGTGAGGFTIGTPITSTETSFDPTHIVASDFNDDGLPDLVYSDGSNPDLYLALDTNTGTFGAPAAIPVDGAVMGLAAGDLNRDEVADLVATVSTGTGTGTVDVLLNSGSGAFAAAVAQPTSIASPGPVAIGDINDDNLVDIVAMNSSGALDVFPGIGGGFFGAGVVSQATSGSPQAIVTSDVNDDSKADVLFSETDPAIADGGGFGVVLGASAPELSTGIGGALPASVIAGTKATIVQTVSLANISGNLLKGDVTISVALSSDANYSSDDTVVDAFNVKEKIANGKSKSQRVKISKVPAGVAPGNYFLVVQVTDPGGGVAMSGTSGTIDIVAPRVDLSGAFRKVPSAAVAGKRLNASIIVTNSGNVPVAGVLPIIVDASTLDTLSDAAVQLLDFNKRVSLKPGKSVTISLGRLIAPATPNDDYLIVELDPDNTLGDANTANNTFATSAPIAVG